MKKTLFLASVIVSLFAMASCSSSSTRNFSNFLTKHNFKESHEFDPIAKKSRLEASIDSLYDYSKVVELCDTTDITFHVSRGKITILATCDGAVEKLSEIFKKIFAEIKFTK